jgi:hypothetical protein
MNYIKNSVKLVYGNFSLGCLLSRRFHPNLFADADLIYDLVAHGLQCYRIHNILNVYAFIKFNFGSIFD